MKRCWNLVLLRLSMQTSPLTLAKVRSPLGLTAECHSCLPAPVCPGSYRCIANDKEENDDNGQEKHQLTVSCYCFTHISSFNSHNYFLWQSILSPRHGLTREVPGSQLWNAHRKDPPVQIRTGGQKTTWQKTPRTFLKGTDGFFDCFGYVGSTAQFCYKARENLEKGTKKIKQQKKQSISVLKKQYNYSTLYDCECISKNADMLIMICRYQAGKGRKVWVSSGVRKRTLSCLLAIIIGNTYIGDSKKQANYRRCPWRGPIQGCRGSCWGLTFFLVNLKSTFWAS